MKDRQTKQSDRYYIIAIFLVVTLLAISDILQFIPFFAPFVASPFYPFFHESHDLLGLILALYAAHKFSPTVGWWCLGWSVALHIPYILVVFPSALHELVRLTISIVSGAVGIRIIAIRNQLQIQLGKLAADLETQRTLAFQRADELTLLNSIATVGVEATSVDALIENAILVINNLLHPDYFDVGLVDSTAGILRVFRSAPGESLAFPLGKGVVGQVLATGKVWRIPDARHEPIFYSMNPDSLSELCVPLKIGEQVIGLLNIENKHTDGFSKNDERVMISVAGQLAIAIEKVRLFQLAQRQAQEAETLRRAGTIVASTLKQDEAIELILVQLARVVAYDTASVQLLGDGYLEIVGGHGWADPAAVVGMRFPIPGDNPNTIVIQQGRPHILGDAPSSHAAFREGPHSHIHSFLGVPLIVGDKVIGMLAVDNTLRNYFTLDHARLVTAFADQVALAIQNARLFGEVQQLASIDSLTGLHNRRHFMELSKREFERARRYQRSLTAVMLDIDHFKIVNDTHGHDVGDQVLRIVAERCQKTVREIDIIGRYGGEEFVMLLLETDIAGARIVSERLRAAIAENPVRVGDDLALNITASFGVAQRNENTTNLEILITRADQAMYVAKHKGRNRVAVGE